MEDASQRKVSSWGIRWQKYNLEISYIDHKTNCTEYWLLIAPRYEIDYRRMYSLIMVWSINFNKGEYTIVPSDFTGPRMSCCKYYHINVAIDHCPGFIMEDSISLLKNKWIPVFDGPHETLTGMGAIYDS